MRLLVRAARELDARDALFVARAAVLAVALPPLLRVVPLPRLVALVAGREGRSRHVPAPPRMVRLTDGVLRRGRGPFRANCAVRSLIVLRYLRRRGEPVSVSFGVRREPGRLDGHAWVSLGGVPLAEARDPRAIYRTTYQYPSEGTA